MDRTSLGQIYLDNMASTPCDPRVLESMLPFLTHEFANPSSPHRCGVTAARALEVARAQVAGAMGSLPHEVIFTSGATESNNLALQGVVRAYAGSRRKIVTTAIEHKSVLFTCDYLTAMGFKVVVCPVGLDGRVDLAAFAEAVDHETLLVSVQYANNEIGTIQPIFEIAQLARRVGAIVHTDAAQAFGKVRFSVEDLDVDLASFSAHKCYGPKGVGALYIRGGARSGLIAPLVFGGGQEYGLRSGTENVSGAVGFGTAAEICRGQVEHDAQQTAMLRGLFEHLLETQLSGIRLNGCTHVRLPGSTSVTVHGVEAEAIVANLPEIALSSSSACSSGALSPSHVLLAIGLSREQAYSTIRIGIGRFNVGGDLVYAARRVTEIISRLRNL